MASTPDPVHGTKVPSSPPPATHEVGEDGSQHKDGGHGSLLPMSDTLPAGYPRDTEYMPSHTEGVSRGFEKRDSHLDIRVSSRERGLFEARARLLGIKTGAWVRAIALDELDARHDNVDAITRARMAFTPRPELAHAVEQVRRVGVNLNQAVRKNLTVDDDLLREVLATLQAVRETLGDRTSL